MATSTLAQLRDRVVKNRFDANIYQSRVDGWLNEGQGRIARRANVPTLLKTHTFSTVAGTYSYVFPADFARALFVIPTDGLSGPLDWVESQLEIRRETLLCTPTRPRYWTAAGAILLGPVPDAVYALEMSYQRLPVVMGSDTSTPEIPEDYADMLVTYAVSKCYRAEDDVDAGKAWMADFESDLAGFKVDLRNESEDGPTQVQGTF